MNFYVVTSYQALLKNFSHLKRGDLVLSRIPIRSDNFHLLFDLEKRGVIFFPSLLSQILSHSKVAQAEILRNFILPDTYVIRNKTDLLQIMEKSVITGEVITKKDFANCGLGICLWKDLEEVFKFAGTEVLPFPFVLQPFYRNWLDIRVILLGEKYIEAYLRENPKNFRQNLFFGGKAKAYELSEREIDFCKRVMKRGEFPYAHLDLTYINGEGPFLSEINLKGGIKGARITPEKYEEILQKIKEDYFKKWKELHQPYEILSQRLSDMKVF